MIPNIQRISNKISKFSFIGTQRLCRKSSIWEFFDSLVFNFIDSKSTKNDFSYRLNAKAHWEPDLSAIWCSRLSGAFPYSSGSTTLIAPISSNGPSMLAAPPCSTIRSPTTRSTFTPVKAIALPVGLIPSHSPR